MKWLFILILGLIGEVSAQVQTRDFVIQIKPGKHQNELLLYPCDQIGIGWEQFGVEYCWYLDSLMVKGAFQRLYISDSTTRTMNICMIAYVSGDSANTVIKVCKSMYYDASLYEFTGLLIPHAFFNDKNSNCNHDFGEELFQLQAEYSGKKLTFNNRPDFNSDTTRMLLLPDTFDVKFLHPNATYGSCKKPQIISDSAKTNTVQLIPVRVDTTFFDVGVDMFRTQGWNPGYTGQMQIQVFNTSLLSTKVSLNLSFPDSIFYHNSSLSPNVSSSGSLKWELNMAAQSNETIYLDLLISQYYSNTDTVDIDCLIISAMQDSDTLNNYVQIKVPLSGSYDPNDITVYGRHPLNSTYPVEYRIRFQNTGNDFARNILIRDTLPPQAQPESLKIIAASHAVQTKINGSKLEFKFSNIMLPDSGADEEKSHGFVKYSILMRKENGSNTFDSISNRASIYFDYNAPVMTNTAVIYAEVSVAKLKDPVKNLSNWLVYPNPAKDEIIIRTKDAQIQTEMILYDLRGRAVQTFIMPKGASERKFILDPRIVQGLYIIKSVHEGKSIYCIKY